MFLRIFSIFSLLLLTKVTLNAQVNETFNDSDFTQNPTWQADTSKWRVLNQELNSKSLIANDTFFIATPSSLLSQAEWSCKIRLTFSTSGANYVDMFVAASSPSLTSAANNGYFVRIGGTSDEISLYRKSGTTLTEIIDGLDGRSQFSTSNNTILIRLTRNASGLWTLQSDNGNGSGFFTEGDTIETTFTSSSWFGFLVRQSTATFFERHFFDDILVQPLTVDTTPPVATGISVLSDTVLQVQFNEPVSPSGNFTISPGNLVPVSVSNTSPAVLRLSFSSAFVPNQNYSLQVNGVQDLIGNTMIAGQSFPFVWAPPFTPGFRQLVINELLADPSPQVGLPNSEFIEIFNPGTQSVSLLGYRLADPGTTTQIGQNVSIAPGGFVILCPIASVPLFQAFGNVIGLSSWPSLNNDRDTIRFSRPDGILIDELAYSNTWYASTLKRDGGWTLEQKNPFSLCTGRSNWSESQQSAGGTPGAINSTFDTTSDTQKPVLTSAALSGPGLLRLQFNEILDSLSVAQATVNIGGVLATGLQLSGDKTQVTAIPGQTLVVGQLYPLLVSGIRDCPGNTMDVFQTSIGLGEVPLEGDLIITEIMADESPALGQPLAEYVEIYNRSSKLIELEGTVFSDPSTSTTLFPGLLQPDSFIIIHSASSNALFQAAAYRRQGLSPWPGLNNTGELIQLTNVLNNVVDQVNYTDDWYLDPIKKEGGYSLELINPTLPCSGSGNWRASNHPSGGTPGAQNSVWNTSPDTLPPLLLEAIAETATRIKLRFSETLGSASILPDSLSLTPFRQIIQILQDSDEPELYFVFLADSLNENLLYTLKLSGWQDCSGNGMATVQFQTGLGKTPGFLGLIITEIMADESPAFGPFASEFLEIKNNSAGIVNTDGCRLQDQTGSVALPIIQMLPGERVVFCPSSSISLFSSAAGAKVIGLSGWLSLNNTGENLSITNANGALVFSMSYTDDWYNDAVKKEGGWSLEMLDERLPCLGISNWSASVALLAATPGAINSTIRNLADLSPPEILKADIENPSHVLIKLNEHLDSTAISGWNIGLSSPNGVLNINKVELKLPEFELIELSLDDTMKVKVPYKLSLSGLADCSGNRSTLSERTLYLPEPAQEGDLQINEILYNPFPGGVDFVELVNTSSKFIDLRYWQLARVEEDSLGSFSTITDLPFIIGPGDYVTITTKPDLISRDYPSFRKNTALVPASMPSFNDDEGTIVLLNSAAEIVDQFAYTDDLHLSLIDDTEGISLEKRNPKLNSMTPENWTSAATTVNATPGYRNSQFSDLPGVTSGTIEIKPAVFTPDGDGNNDQAFIYYQFGQAGFIGNATVFDSYGREIKRIAKNTVLGTEGFLIWDGSNEEEQKAPVGSYLIMLEVFQTQGTTAYFKRTVVLGARL
jgi:hypothetical protein